MGDMTRVESPTSQIPCQGAAYLVLDVICTYLSNKLSEGLLPVSIEITVSHRPLYSIILIAVEEVEKEIHY
jgi:hypothetical protein